MCIGCIAAELDGPNIIVMRSCPIMPPKLDVRILGLMRTKKKLPTPSGNKLLSTWYQNGEHTVTEKEKKRRDVFVREKENNFKLANMSATMGNIINNIKPNVMSVEQNAMFNGVLTIALLAEVMGTLVGIAGNDGTPLNKYKVSTVREAHNVAKLVKEFAKKHTPEYLVSLPDITKAALRDKMQTKYGIYGLDLKTDDEGDAAVVFDYWYNNVYLPSLV